MLANTFVKITCWCGLRCKPTCWPTWNLNSNVFFYDSNVKIVEFRMFFYSKWIDIYTCWSDKKVVKGNRTNIFGLICWTTCWPTYCPVCAGLKRRRINGIFSLLYSSTIWDRASDRGPGKREFKTEEILSESSAKPLWKRMKITII